MEVVFTRDELRRCLPPAGRYRATLQVVTPTSDDPRPAAIFLTWAVLDPPNLPPIYDRFVLRGPVALALPGLRRFLGLLHLAGLTVHPGQPVDLDGLLGLECFLAVERALDAGGFPYSRVCRYQRATGLSAPRATNSRRCNGGADAPASR